MPAGALLQTGSQSTHVEQGEPVLEGPAIQQVIPVLGENPSSYIHFCLLFIRTLGITFRTPLDNSRQSFHLIILNFIISVKSLLPYKITFRGSRK